MNNKNNIQTEQQLIIAAQQNPDRFSVLYDMHYKRMFLFVYSKVKNQELTADLTSQVFLKAMLGIKKYQFKGIPFVAWLYRIASNEVNMYFRQSKKEQTVEITEQIVADIIDDSEINILGNKQGELIAALNQLKEQESNLIDLRFFEKLSFQEISVILGLTADNAKIKLYRVLKKLKAIIEVTSND